MKTVRSSENLTEIGRSHIKPSVYSEDYNDFCPEKNLSLLQSIQSI